MNPYFTPKELVVIDEAKNELDRYSKLLVKYRTNTEWLDVDYERILLEKIENNIFILSAFNLDSNVIIFKRKKNVR